jgi:membrane associated rhomboid family serine protease
MSITLAILILTVLISLQGFKNMNVIERLKHHPWSEHNKKEYYRLLASGFVHANTTHLFINAFVLYMFGMHIESVFKALYGSGMGPVYFIFMYCSAIVVADMPTHFRYKNTFSYSAVGASGATSALVLIYCLLDPWSWFLYPPVPAIIFAAGFIYYSHWADKRQYGDGIGHSAHLFGALYGILFILLTKPVMIMNFVSKIMEGPQWPPPFF